MNEVDLHVLCDYGIFSPVVMYYNTLHLMGNGEKVLQSLVVKGEVSV